MLFCGLRKEEALGVSWEDIDFEKQTVTIHNVVVNPLSGNPYLRPYPKSKTSFRTLPVTKILLDVVILYRNVLEQEKEIKGLLFTGQNNKPISNSAFYKRWNNIKKIAQINCVPHDLRHRFATDLYYSGVKIKEAQYLLGHATASLTIDLYTHLDNEKVTQDSGKKHSLYVNDYTSDKANK